MIWCRVPVHGFVLLAAASLVSSVTVPRRADGQGTLRVESATFKDGGMLTKAQEYNGMQCSGGNVSPELHWSAVPAGTKSLGLTMYDPDAPTGSGWWHWVVYNIPASTTSLPLGAGDASGAKLPAGTVQGRTDFGKPGYGGPCPPPGKPHHYIFTLYALKVPSLALDKDASAAMVSANLHGNSVGKATVTGLYGR
jgi:Raf kinase inhibitor-like YbhB/YbcL family protein